jgi:hypothetical protein
MREQRPSEAARLVRRPLGPRLRGGNDAKSSDGYKVSLGG